MIFGLIGEKLSHSYSPEIHRAFFEITGIKGEYRLFELQKEEIAGFLKRAVKEKLAGMNVTIPYKTEIIRYIEVLSLEAKKIGAVNTIVLNHRLTGYNTDYYGIDYTFRKNKAAVCGRKVLVTGSGGAAKAVICYLQDQHVGQVYIASRNPNLVNRRFPGTIPLSYRQIKELGPYDIIINTTPVGMVPHPNDAPLAAEELEGAGFLFDLIYNPYQTRLIKMAQSMNIPSTNGLPMLVAQAVKSQEIWNEKEYGIEMVDRIMKEIVKRSFASGAG